MRSRVGAICLVLVVLFSFGIVSVSAQTRPTPEPAQERPTIVPTQLIEPAQTAKPDPTSTPLPTATATPNPTQTPYPTYTPFPTRTPLPTPDPTSTPYPTYTPFPTSAPLPTQTTIPNPTSASLPTREATQTAQPTATDTPTATRTPNWSATQTARPTMTPTPLPPTGTPDWSATKAAETSSWIATQTAQPTATSTPTATVTPSVTNAPVLTTSRLKVQTVATPDNEGTVYAIVAAGDTIEVIAYRYGVPMAEILANNGLVADDFIYPGQRLVISRAPTPIAALASEPTADLIVPTEQVVIQQPDEPDFSNEPCTVLVDAFMDANEDGNRQPGEGIESLLIVVSDRDRTWQLKRYTANGVVSVRVPCVSMAVDAPYLFERRMVSFNPDAMVSAVDTVTIQLSQPVPALPRMLP